MTGPQTLQLGNLPGPNTPRRNDSIVHSGNDNHLSPVFDYIIVITVDSKT